VAAVLARPRIGEHVSAGVGQAHRVVQLAIGQHPSIGGDHTAAKLEHPGNAGLDVRTLLEHVLIDGGYEVDATETVKDGCELLGSRDYDLEIADGRLSDGFGMEVADRAGEKGIRALIVTGYGFTLPRDGIERYDVLLKPLRPSELIAAVERALTV
jgi:CheY-like chemotaxis protein